jgi:hypothetical protein
VLKVNGEYVVERIAESLDDVTIYFKILHEQYYLGVRISKVGTSVNWVFIENGNKCYLAVRSDVMSLDELARFMPLKCSSGYSKGELRKSGLAAHSHSGANYVVLDSECYDTEDAINLLLNFLEPYKNEIIELSKNASAHVAICKNQYVSGNAGLHFDVSLISRLNEFNLALDIDLYIVGNAIL